MANGLCSDNIAGKWMSLVTCGGGGLHCEQFLLYLKQFTLNEIFTDISEALLWEKHAVDSCEDTLQIFLAVSICVTHPTLTSQNWTPPFHTRHAEPPSIRPHSENKERAACERSGSAFEAG